MELKTGQEVYLKPINNAARGGGKEPIKEVISKVGRKYFELTSGYYGKFHIDTMLQEAGGYTSNYQVYLSLQELLDENELHRLWVILHKTFSAYSPTLDLTTVRAVCALLNNGLNVQRSDTTTDDSSTTAK